MANQSSPAPFGTPPSDPSVGAIDAQTAAELIRKKLELIYNQEPDALHELAEAEATPRRSKHQEYMYQLSASGKDLATVQTEWHNYYQQLSDAEKHAVWQEFYASQPTAAGAVTLLSLAENKQHVTGSPAARERATKAPKLRDARSAKEVQAALLHNVSAGGKLTVKHHLQSLLFGLGMGLIVIFIFLFGFFNEIIIAPFIQPSRQTASTPLIVGDGNNVAPTNKPEVIIPKINVEIPVNYTETSTDENVIENDLEDGVVHYPTTVLPGQIGNTAFFGHSSNNIFNPGHYKFAFVLLHTLVEGDTFYLTYNGQVYVYKVIDRRIVDPSDVSVLNAVPGQTATATLITCDPPGTSLHRLVVIGQQIKPNPSGNVASTPKTATGSTPDQLPSEGPTLWTRIERTATGKAVFLAIIAVGAIGTIRWINAPTRRSKSRDR